MPSVKGRALTAEEKKLTVSLKHYFDRNKSEFCSKDTSVQMVSDAFGFGTATIFRIMAEYNKDPGSIEAKRILRGRPEFSIDASQQEIVRACIRAANMEGAHITLETINDFLQKNKSDESFHITTLARTLDRWGFEYGKGVRTSNSRRTAFNLNACQ